MSGKSAFSSLTSQDMFEWWTGPDKDCARQRHPFCSTMIWTEFFLPRDSDGVQRRRGPWRETTALVAAPSPAFGLLPLLLGLIIGLWFFKCQFQSHLRWKHMVKPYTSQQSEGLLIWQESFLYWTSIFLQLLQKKNTSKQMNKLVPEGWLSPWKPL